MAYRMTGTVVSTCHCHDICPCSVDAAPNGPNGECRGFLVFGIEEGDADGTDLGGVNAAFVVNFPSNPSGGNWRVGIIVDEGASDDQAKAVERVLLGEDGGPWADFAALRTEYLGLERAPVSYTGGDQPTSSVPGKAEMSIEPFRDGEGNVTRLTNAAFGLAPEFAIGKSTGSCDAFGISFDSSYGEFGAFEFAS